MNRSTYSQSTLESPFNIHDGDVATVCASPGFQVLRSYLAQHHDNSFCSEHEACNDERREQWLLQRDIIHALIMPIVQLFNRASRLAQAATCSNKSEDFELAFRDDGRGAFVQLQCFLTEENEWCYTQGCPACVVSDAMSTEAHLRVLVGAILLSDIATPTNTPTSPTLPSFSFFHPVVRNALAEDDFWGESFIEHIEARAEQLCDGTRTIMEQCGELEVLVTSPTASPARSPVRNAHRKASEEFGDIKIKPSRLAKRQTRLREEEEALFRRIAYQAWGAVAMPKNLRAEMKASISSHKRHGSF